MVLNVQGLVIKKRPSLATIAKQLPTPTAHMAKETNAPSEALRNQPSMTSIVGGTLNPVWVEWLMGWPLGWTDLKPIDSDDICSWDSEPDVGRVAHGVDFKNDRLKAIGNGQVPLCAAMAWRLLVDCGDDNDKKVA